MVLTKELRKYIKSLQYVKYRQKYNKFIAEGPKICLEFLRNRAFEIEYIVCTQIFYDKHINLLGAYMGRTIICNDNELKSISSLKNPNKILIVAASIKQASEGFDPLVTWAIYCDRIQDPGNMGTIMRIADWFGISRLMLAEDCVDIYNAKVVQSAMGAHCRVVTSIVSRRKLIDEYARHLYVLSLNGVPFQKLRFPEGGILVVGNESKGASEEIIRAATAELLIKRYGGAESLNASVACGIACHYIVSGRDPS